VWNAHNTEFGSKCSTVCAHCNLFIFWIWRGLVSRDSIVDGDWLPATECYQRYLPCCQSASDIAKHLWRFLVRSVHSRRMTWIDSNGKNRNQKSRRGLFWKNVSGDLWSFRSYSGLKSQDVSFLLNFSIFGKTTPYGKLSKILFREFLLRHRSTCCV